MPPLSDARKFALVAAAALAALSLVPIVAYLGLEAWSAKRCTSATVAEGKLDGALAWRITRSDCAGASAPYYDVSVGAEGHVPATAVTSRGAPVPRSVRRLAEDRLGVELDRPWRGETMVVVRLRRTGGPAERIDLNAETR